MIIEFCSRCGKRGIFDTFKSNRAQDLVRCSRCKRLLLKDDVIGIWYKSEYDYLLKRLKE